MDKSIDVLSVEQFPAYYSDSSTITGHESKLKELGLKASARLKEIRSLEQMSRLESERALDFEYYHLRPPKKAVPYAGYPNLACPLPRIGSDTYHANVMFTFAGQSGKFTVLPEYISRSHMDSADRGAKYLTYVLNHEADFYTALDKADQNAQTYGEGYLEPCYVREYAYETRLVTREEVVPEIDELTGEVTRKTVKHTKKERVKVLKFDGVKIKSIDPRSIVVAPEYEEVEDAVTNDYLFKITKFKYRALEEFSKQVDKEIPAFFKADAVKKLRDSKLASLRTELDNAKQEYDGFTLERQLENSDVELAECHFWADINDDGFAEKVTLVIEAQTGIVLRATFSECRIVKLCPRPVAGRWHGESVRRLLMSFCDEWEAIHNQRVAKGQWANLPFFFYRAGGRFNPQTLTLMPGKGYPLDDPNSVSFPQLPSADMSYFQEEKLILDYVERVLALGEAQQGVVSRNDTTATESINAQQKAGIRLSNPMNRIAVSLNKLMGHIWELNKQCAPEIKEFKVAGVGDGTPIFDKVTNRDYEAQVSFKMNMATLFDVQMLRDTALLNYDAFMQNPLVMSHPAAMYELTKNTMKALGVELNIPKPEQANAKSPFVEHDLIMAGRDDIEPVLGEDTTEHLLAHDALIKSEEFKDWPEDRQMAMILHRDKTVAQQQLLRSANLNQSGIFEGLGPQQPEMPGFTANLNPAQKFNTMRAEESPKSQRQNLRNGMQGGY